MLENILIADDHEIVFNGLKTMIETHFGVKNIYYAETGVETINIISAHKEIELLILDISMPFSNIFQIVPEIKRKNPNLKILVFTMLSARIYENRLYKLGVNGFVEKTQPLLSLKDKIQSIILGKGKVYDSENLKGDANNNPLDLLSNKELQIAQYLTSGDTNTTIAHKLGLMQSTIGTYKSRIFEKLEISSVLELVEIINRYQS
jgi:DNA-binding NarL/FixJ family response regulator